MEKQPRQRNLFIIRPAALRDNVCEDLDIHAATRGIASSNSESGPRSHGA
jgi:hypothetical protein